MKPAISDLQRQILEALAQGSTLTDAEIRSVIGATHKRGGLSNSLAGLYHRGMVDAPHTNPLRYSITQEGRLALA